MEKKLIYQIQIEGNEHLLSEMAKIRKENDELKKVNKEYNDELKKGNQLNDDAAKTFERNAAQIKTNNQQLNSLTKSVQINSNATKGLRTELTDLRQRMQDARAAGDTQSKAYQEMRKRAGELQDSIDQVNREIKVFSDDAMIMNTVVDTARGMAQGFQLVHSAQALLGFESEKFQEVMQKLVATQTLINSLQGVQNMLMKNSRVMILAKVGATKVATAAQWAWNVAMNANPIGLIVTTVVALGTAIYALVKNIDVVTNAFRRLGSFLGILKKETEEVAIETDNLTSAVDRYNSAADEQIENLRHQIRLLRAQGASIEDITEAQKQLIESQIQEAILAERRAHAKMNWSEMERDEYEKIRIESEKTVQALINDLEVLNAEEERRLKQREERRVEEARKVEETRTREAEREEEEARKKAEADRKKIDDELNRVELAQAELLVLLNDSEENRIILETVKHRQLMESRDDWTREEIELMKERHRLKLEELKEQEEIEIDEEQRKRIEERKRYEDELEQRRQDELGHFVLRQQQLDEWLKNDVISREEYAAEVKRLNDDIAQHEIELSHQRAEANLNLTRTLISNLQQSGMAESKAAKFAQLLAIAESIFNISVGMARTASTGFPQNIPFLLGFAAQTASIVAQIKKIVVPQPPKMARGGRITIGGKPHSQGGTKFYGEDGNVFEAEKDEELFIINKYDSKTIDLLSDINSRHGVSFSNSPKNYFADGGRFSPRQDFEKFNLQDMVREVVDEITHIPVVVSERDISSTQNNVRKIRVAGNL